jgi:hypothetical protein
MHYIGALVKDLHVRLQDVKVEGGCQQAAVLGPLITFAKQKPIPWDRKTEVRGLSCSSETLQEDLGSALLLPESPVPAYPLALT